MATLPKTKLDETERMVVLEAKAIVEADQFRQVSDAGRQGRAFEVVIRQTVIVVQPDLPSGYCGMSLFGEHGFVLGREAFTSTEQLHRTILWELYRLMTGQALTIIAPGEAGHLHDLTANFRERAWPWFRR